MQKDNNEGESELKENLLGKIEISSNTVKLLNTLKGYKVISYDLSCEEYNQILNIIPVNYSPFKIIALVFLTIITASFFGLFVIWFPKLKMYFIYSESPIHNAKYLCILGKDQKYYFISLERIKLPKLSSLDSFLYSQYKNNFSSSSNDLLFFTFKLYKYIFLPNEDNFVGFSSKLDTTYHKILSICSQGLTEKEIRHQKLLYGVCDLEIEIKGFFTILCMEFTDPFYIFQVCSIILWFNNDYLSYAILIIVLTSFSLIEGSYETRKNLKTIQQMAKYSCDIEAYRKVNDEQKYVRISSTDLVPGDVFVLNEEGTAVPCDCILIQGTVIINEAMLTGESTPIIKNQIQDINEYFDLENEKKNFLFAGTKIIQKR